MIDRLVHHAEILSLNAFASDHQREGMAAFFEKREPRFTGR